MSTGSASKSKITNEELQVMLKRAAELGIPAWRVTAALGRSGTPPAATGEDEAHP
ncbi:hypothetical protein NBH00_23580 [Paraconexibacter antarcticus]|uniref:Uncharacterized protein n=1 Tax=Paraconexibacter antarcticus TaxID=2949664 RepID=A0ABY5DRU1_9ACTN|nr:hypothetical protein [Paraconexibacter antarcticus]UTI64309.1 hypothetical protein NBH00_23580 [Paraconexibacter antarcticus]